MIENNSYNWKKGATAVYPDVNKHLGAILGAQNTEKYKEIFPVLALIFLDINTRYIQTGRFSALFSYDEELPRGGVRGVLSAIRRAKFKSLCKDTKKLPQGDATMLSATFAFNPRYKATLAQLKSMDNITHFLSEVDVVPAVSKKGISFNDMHYTVQPVIWQGSVSGKKLKAAVLDVCEFLARLISENDCCENHREESEKLFSALEKEYLSRIQLLCDVLSQRKIKRYITINQFSLRDIMIIDACRRLGIPTRQMEHHSSLCMHLEDKPVPIYRYAYTDEFCVWSEDEKYFHSNFYCYQPMFGQDITLKVVGNPEISWEKANEEYKKYPAKNQIVYMVSGIMNESDYELFNANFRMQQRIFRQLGELKEKTGWDVLVRFPPKINPKMMAVCSPILHGMGIKTSQSLPGTLMEDMCQSRIVFGTISSVLSTSVIMGRKVYQIITDDAKPLYTEKAVTAVNIENIAGIDTRDWQNYPLELERDNFIDYRKLLGD